MCENSKIQSTSIWYKNHQEGILHVTKVVTGYIQESWLKILVGAQTFPTPSCLHSDLYLPPDVLLIQNHTKVINSDVFYKFASMSPRTH